MHKENVLPLPSTSSHEGFGTQIVAPEKGPWDPSAHGLQIASDVAVPNQRAGEPPACVEVQVVVLPAATAVQVTQMAEPSAGPNVPASHASQTASVVAVARTLRAVVPSA